MVFSLNADNFTVRNIVSVYDGDTFKVDLKCNRKIFCSNIPVRVYGIDTPEFRGSSEKEKKLADDAKQITINFLFSSKTIYLNNCIRGKYFRIVCEVSNDKDNLSDILLKHNLAVPYFGGTKVKDWNE